MNITIEDRAREIAEFLGKDYGFCLATLKQGFGYLHGQVAQDWRAANPQTDHEILAWYRTTESYIWELSAYHLDPGFNYSGMCEGVSEALRAKGLNRVLCLGDGIGDLSLRLAQDGFDAVYHDLAGSRTANFAYSRLLTYSPFAGKLHGRNTSGWEPLDISGVEPFRDYHAVVSLDYLEHVPNVEEWVRAIFSALKPGGYMMTQNAFACGSGPNGSIPMHLACNDHFEFNWDPLCERVGFVQESSNWYRRPL